MKSIAVAIDGPSGAGKSTIARAVAGRLGFVYVDTGAMYRTIGLAVCRAGVLLGETEKIPAVLDDGLKVSLKYEAGTQHVLLNGEDVSSLIRTPEISKYASFVSAVPAVRAFLLDTQREMAKTHNVIMDGRDIGTVILPDAAVKIFLTASAQARARRRFLELQEKGETVTFDEVLADMVQRDHDDMARAAAPLRQAEDAILVDTSELTLEQSMEAVEDIIRRALEV
ncbi:MAG: (d)CMP kinase [Eubacteriales bacterium]|nr:(d)CMP kinase [Eubacteriales bacterium]